MNRDASLWVVSSYFNPMRWRRRRDNYRVFRGRLGAPLLTVELGRDGEFDLAEGDADIMVRIPLGDVLWQKERLLNVAIQSLPASCVHVAWLDCDVIIERPDWMIHVARLLRHAALVQLFEEVVHLPPDWDESSASGCVPILCQRSTASVVTPNEDARARIASSIGRTAGATANGFGWAAPRSLLGQYSFFDRSILGGGDTVLLAAAYGCQESVMEHHAMNPAQREACARWSDAFARAASGGVAAMQGRLLHLWHGGLHNRDAVGRHARLRPFDFDPDRDIRLGPGGAWTWSTDKPALHRYVFEYLASRREDG